MEEKINRTRNALRAHDNLRPITRLFTASYVVVSSSRESDVPPQGALAELEAAMLNVCDATLGLGEYAISTTNKVEESTDGSGTERTAIRSDIRGTGDDDSDATTDTGSDGGDNLEVHIPSSN